MFKNLLKRNACWIISCAVLLSLASCAKKAEEPSEESSKKTVITMKPEPQTKEVPVHGQMGVHGGMSGEAIGAHGRTMGAHGGMSGGSIGPHGGMTPVVTPGDLAEPFKAKRKSTRTVEVPEEVKEKWKEVSIHVRDKKTGESKHYKVQVSGDFKVPGTDLDIKIGNFLPHFTMPTGGKITSASNEPNNPALQVTISENNEEKYRGWLFANFPEMHAFEHEKYAITLDKDF
jgi:hypothetical protein